MNTVILHFLRLSLLVTLLFSQLVVAKTTVAIIDSGVDYQHELYEHAMWKNAYEVPGNNRDEDGNGYEDDLYGWNFAEDNEKIIDYSYLETFSDAPFEFFVLQGEAFLIGYKMTKGTANTKDLERLEEIKKWMNAKRGDSSFIKEMQIFGNFVHGTHVAGIASGGLDHLKIMGVKLLPTEVKLPGKLKPGLSSGGGKGKKKKGKVNEAVMRYTLKKLAATQVESLKNIAVYLDGHGVDVANGSFGTGFHQAKMIVNMLGKVMTFGRGMTEELKDKFAKYFLAVSAEVGKSFVKLAPNTLFVFAAGNDGLDNDTYGTTPANIDADNVITVAATYDNLALAPFSNYGQKVHLAAPGVIIKSSVPGNEYLQVSGTSQAAPYVAHVAANIKEINPKLTPKQIKSILLKTVTPASFLQDKVLTHGYIAPKRAYQVAKLSLNQNLSYILKKLKPTPMQFVEKSFMGVNSSEVFKGLTFKPIELAPVYRAPQH